MLDEMTTKTPCKVSWESMVGDERTRFCVRCSKNVYDLRAMTEDEAESFLAVHLDDADARVRLYRRSDGRLLTTDCPVGATRRHRGKVAVVGAAATVTIAGVASLVGDLDVPRAHSPLHATHSRFEPPRPVPNDPVRLVGPADEPPMPPPPGAPPRGSWDDLEPLEYKGGLSWEERAFRQAFGRSPTLHQGVIEVGVNYPPEVVGRIVRQNFGRFRLCYEQALTRVPKLEGRFTTSFVIDPQGSATAVKMEEREGPVPELREPELDRCIIHVFEKLTFPSPEREAVRVVFPIIFRPGERVPSVHADGNE
jgi:hypothetical protein